MADEGQENGGWKDAEIAKALNASVEPSNEPGKSV